MTAKLFYRISTDEVGGLWYNKEGKFTGRIHTPEYDFCVNANLEMPFDPEITGYISVVESLEGLYKWFSKHDISVLQDKGFTIKEVLAIDYKFYNPFEHFLVNETTSALNHQIKLF